MPAESVLRSIGIPMGASGEGFDDGAGCRRGLGGGAAGAEERECEGACATGRREIVEG